MSEPLVSTVRKGTIDSGAEAPEKFPFDAFEFDPPSGAAPILTLRSPWKLAAASWVSGTAAALASLNAVVPIGQIAFETDTVSIKIGDGSTAYNSLTYVYRGLPVAGEPSLGTGHFTGRATPTDWDIKRTEGTVAPYVWDLSGFASCPVGTKAVKLLIQVAFYGTAASIMWEGYIWDFDFGAFNVFESVTRGAYLHAPYKPATAAAEYQIAVGEYEVKIGPSRKLYVGTNVGVAGKAINGMFRQAVL
jgi:hypothetical protein